MSQPPAALAQAREQFLAMVEALRPDLHRYCARLTGSVVEGEDIVQDTLAKAFYALSLQAEVPPLRPWLFRIAHNQAMDFLKSHAQKYTELREGWEDVADTDGRPDALALRSALASFLVLPVQQRSAVILKDVLGQSLEETAETLGVSVLAVKALLVRGRAQLEERRDEPTVAQPGSRLLLDRYAALFNARDWEGLRQLVSVECELDLVSKSQRRGKAVGMYFARYEKEDVSLRVVRLEQGLALAAYVAAAALPSYFVLLCWDAGLVSAIRDFRYVPYMVADADYEQL